MARMSAIEAGRKGGQARSIRKTLACRVNGFQPCKTSETEHPVVESVPERRNASASAVLFTPRKQGE